MQRKDFLKKACRICLLGTGVSSVIDLAGCSPAVANNLLKPEVIDNKIQVPLHIFDKDPQQIISPKKYPFEIAVEKKSDNTFRALLLKCTHQENQLTPTGNGFTCSVHGSRFDKEGSVLTGPAEYSLQQLKTIIIQNNLFIQLK